jgi:hypothetical protein
VHIVIIERATIVSSKLQPIFPSVTHFACIFP